MTREMQPAASGHSSYRQLELRIRAPAGAVRRLGCGFRDAGGSWPPADEEHAIDTTIVRAQQHAAGVKGVIKIERRLAARAAAPLPFIFQPRLRQFEPTAN
jgi:hypothetical protein